MKQLDLSCMLEQRIPSGTKRMTSEVTGIFKSSKCYANRIVQSRQFGQKSCIAYTVREVMLRSVTKFWIKFGSHNLRRLRSPPGHRPPDIRGM